MSVPRSEHQSTLLEDGAVLMTGGTVDPVAGDLYDADQQLFNVTADPMVQARARHVALRLTNPAWGPLQGEVLAIGGANIGGAVFGGAQQAQDSVEIYDPATGQFSDFGTMTVARQNHTATELNDGRILIAGGVGRPFISGTAELVSAPTLPPPPPFFPVQLGNISTRLSVGTGENVAIGDLRHGNSGQAGGRAGDWSLAAAGRGVS